ncbi:GYF domain-containing protein [Prosthecobacter vanneervenii]|uniref:GYF domain-containing protein n=1 Tax=Prosthecobacter vanneervenii TaxID=48466 RepID=A0A7W7YFU7_9BACT|nr:hypothetical protein [Prosthecobacter vanneervenii]
MHAAYYIAKGQKTLGPCSKDDLRNFLAYGSIRDSDLVKREDEEQWRPVSSLMELQLEGQVVADGLTVLPTRRRVARYRDYHRVPYNQRGGTVLRRLIMGFLFFPPMLWMAAVALYTDHIFRQKKDENGYLIVWGRWVEVLATVLIILNAILWWMLLSYTAWILGPGLAELSKGMGEAADVIKGLFNDLFSK